MREIDRSRLREFIKREEQSFIEKHESSKKLFDRAKSSLLAGVPMNWMTRWAGPFPIFVREGKGAKLTDVDGNEYIDFCLGDTGSMFGHSPGPLVDAVKTQIERGITMMLPTEDSVWVGEELSRRFGLPYWQVAMTATDANRFSIRLVRDATKRKYVLVYNACYHGTVDEALIELKDGMPIPAVGNIGPPIDPSVTSKVIEFNDLEALEKALRPRDVACVLCEPAMTNEGIILPDPGYHEALREMTTRYDTLLIIDETHTICCGPAGYTGEHGLKPDIITIGKPIGSGIPVAAYGTSEEVAELVVARIMEVGADESGIGGTLSGNALAMAAMRVTLEKIITKDAFDRMMPLAKRFEQGVAGVIEAYRMPWHVIRLGVRAEYRFNPKPFRNGGEAAAAVDRELDQYMHIYALNRGILLTPFHNMVLMSPYTTSEDVDYHTQVFEKSVAELLG